MDSRRKFVKQGITFAAFSSLSPLYTAKDLIIGHGDFKYKVDTNWGKLDKRKTPVKDCHEMVIDKNGRIILLTNDVLNNIIIYNKDGEMVNKWGSNFPGAHGLSIKNEGGEDFLYITDTEKHSVVKHTIDGREVLRLPSPVESGLYQNINQYQPTETAIADNGDIYVADGYGQQYILHYNSKGQLLNTFGGSGEEDEQFYNAHGIAIDSRSGQDKLLITARQQNKLKYFTMTGRYESEVNLPGAYICRPVIHREQVYLATIWSHDGSSNTGFVSILDKENKLVSAPGGCQPFYDKEKLSPMFQTWEVFKHPHDVAIDNDENIYVCQWNAGQVYPYKLIRV